MVFLILICGTNPKVYRGQPPLPTTSPATFLVRDFIHNESKIPRSRLAASGFKDVLTSGLNSKFNDNRFLASQSECAFRTFPFGLTIEKHSVKDKT